MRSCWNLRLSKICFLLAFVPCYAVAQFSESDGFNTKGTGLGSYLFPINPGQPNHLAGTMGELRNTHFHGGIDIRTNNRIGVPVRATQDGYISKVSVNAGSYGTCLYITHPDGKVSVYGHLDKYKGKLATLVKREQYERKSFEVELNFRPNQFVVEKGDTIAFSGNTGSSAGPHLHFEIRDGNYVLNPLKFGFTEIKDNIAPSAQKIALRTLDKNSRINDRFGRFEFSLIKRSANEFVFPVPILATGRIGIELLANDRMDDSPARCGINYIEVFADSQKIFSQHIERVDLDETRGILAVLDYKTLEIKGKKFNKLYIDDGNRLDFYKSRNEGVITMNGADHNIRVQLKDESGNTSNVRLKLKNTALTEEMVLPTSRTAGIEADLLENLLMITARNCGNSESLLVYYQGKASDTKPSYKGANQLIYLIDLKQAQPDSVVNCSGKLIFNFKDVIPSQTEYTYFSDRADVRFPANSLYDTLFLNVNYEVENNREVFTIGTRTVPLHRSVHITLKPALPVSPSKNLGVYRREGRGMSYVGGDWNNGKVRFNARQLGQFIFLADSTPPSVTRIKLDRAWARFRIRDGLSGIDYYEATINGQWLLMSYDFKSGILMSDKLDPKQPLKGDFELKVVDHAGNERIFRQKIL